MLLISLNLSAQRFKNGIDQELKKLFFDLSIDSCQDQIIREIDSNKYFKFSYIGEVDTFRHKNYKFIHRRDLTFSSFKLDNNKQGIVDCDSTIIFLSKTQISSFQSHGKIDYQRLYGQNISILMYFSDSVKATETCKYLTDSISNKLKRKYITAEVEIDKKVNGKASYFKIDRKNNGYEYERNLEITVRSYVKLYEVKIKFEKLTIYPEKCNEK